MGPVLGNRYELALCKSEVSDIISYPEMWQLLNSTTNPGQLLAAKCPPSKGHLAAKGCPGFVVEFNNYSINVDDPMSLTSLLHGAPQFHEYREGGKNGLIFVFIL